MTDHSQLSNVGIHSHDQIDAILDNPYLRLDAPDLTLYALSSDLDLTTAWQDCAGLAPAAFTPAVNETALVCLVAAFDQSAGTAACNAADALEATLSVNAVREAALATVKATGAAGYNTATMFYTITLAADTEYTIKAQAQNATGNRGRLAATTTHMLVWRLPR